MSTDGKEDGPFLSLHFDGDKGKEVDIEAFEMKTSPFEPAVIQFRPAKKRAFDSADLEKAPLEALLQFCNQPDVRQRVEAGLSFSFTSPEERKWYLRADPVGDGYVIYALVGHPEEIYKSEEQRFLS